VTTETIAIIVSGAVALAAIAATWHQHFRALGHERELADLDNVRDILDEAAVALHETAYLLDDVRSFLTQHGGVSFFKTEDGTATCKALGVRGRELDALLERLSVRLGVDHQVVAAFKAADAATLGIWRAAGLLRLEPEADGSTSAANQIRKLNNDKRHETEGCRQAFDAAREAFVSAAHTAAGSRLR
jgi:hypothetical protein